MIRRENMEHSTDDIRTLGAKLDALELTDGERSILDGLFAGEDDVVGHGDLDFGMKIGNLLSSPTPYFDGAGTHLTQGPISGTDLGSGRREGISSGDQGSGR